MGPPGPPKGGGPPNSKPGPSGGPPGWVGAATAVTDDGTNTLIKVGGASLLLENVAGNHPFNFNSLETINDFTDGNYQYEAIDIVIV